MEKEVVNKTGKVNFNGSGRICSVVGCSNSQRKQYIWRNSMCATHNGVLHSECPCLIPFSLHSFPKDERLKLQWISAINRKGYIPGKTAKVCSVHFLGGSPSKENCIPQLLLGYQKKVVVPRRPLKQRSNAILMETKCAESSFDASSTCLDVPIQISENNMPDQSEGTNILNFQNTIGCQVSVNMNNVGTQWEDPTLCDHTYSRTLHVKAASVSTQVDMPTIALNNMSSNDCIFYTGLKLSVFMRLLAWFSVCTKEFPFQLSTEDQLLLVLMRLRLGLLFYDLGRRFKISTTLASVIVNTWLPVMARKLKNLIFWLPRETIHGTLPSCFKTLYPNTTCIIDCTEVFINRPTALKARAQTYSDYKSHNTMKFLVAIAPNGFVMFLSKCFGGRASDKFIVNNSNFLKYILPGDEVLADRGFLIEEEIAMKGAKLNMPAFTKGKKQLSEIDVTETRRIASLRIFVECAIGRIKEFRILRHPLAFGKKNSTADNVILVCAALSNLKSPLIN